MHLLLILLSESSIMIQNLVYQTSLFFWYIFSMLDEELKKTDKK
ncbi:hypothetical protein B4168_3602 [Anoxybacillus flavithermus]|nr:hypothetical protein B4168_3602 [Anoxybacillus flavithermus]OAO87220.1 hypothetical protein GT23_1403 [Parageobacillus thermoglucosidasius]